MHIQVIPIAASLETRQTALTLEYCTWEYTHWHVVVEVWRLSLEYRHSWLCRCKYDVKPNLLRAGLLIQDNIAVSLAS